MAAEGRPFKGVIFFGLMLTPDGPKVLEYNARFGDPEAQVVLPRMKTDIIDVFEACIDGTLDQIDLQFADNACNVCIVLASNGYPVSLRKRIPDPRTQRRSKSMRAITASMQEQKFKDGEIVTNGRPCPRRDSTWRYPERGTCRNAYKAIDWVGFDSEILPPMILEKRLTKRNVNEF